MSSFDIIDFDKKKLIDRLYQQQSKVYQSPKFYWCFNGILNLKIVDDLIGYPDSNELPHILNSITVGVSTNASQLDFKIDIEGEVHTH